MVIRGDKVLRIRVGKKGLVKEGFTSQEINECELSTCVGALTLVDDVYTTDSTKFIWLNGRQIKHIVDNPRLYITNYKLELVRNLFTDKTLTHEEMIIINCLCHEINHDVLLKEHGLTICKAYDNIYRNLRRNGIMA